MMQGVTKAGTLAGVSSCRSLDAMKDTSRFSSASPGTIDITLSSNDFNGSLLLRDAKDNNLTQSDGSANADPHILADVAAGTYSLAALSGDPGNYTMNYKFTPHPLAACPSPQPLDLNSGFIAILGSSSCHGSDGQPADRYQFTTPSAGTAANYMTSSALDSYLTLTDSSGTVLLPDDNSFRRTHSL